MAPIRHTAQARRDILDIWLAIRDHNPAAADRVYDRLGSRLKILEQFPEAGRARPDIAETARALIVPPYVVLYRIRDGGAEIVRVLHGARDIDGELFREDIA